MVTDELEIVDQGRWMAMGQEIADQHRPMRRRRIGSKGGAVFAGESGLSRAIAAVSTVMGPSRKRSVSM